MEDLDLIFSGNGICKLKSKERQKVRPRGGDEFRWGSKTALPVAVILECPEVIGLTY